MLNPWLRNSVTYRHFHRLWNSLLCGTSLMCRQSHNSWRKLLMPFRTLSLTHRYPEGHPEGKHASPMWILYCRQDTKKWPTAAMKAPHSYPRLLELPELPEKLKDGESGMRDCNNINSFFFCDGKCSDFIAQELDYSHRVEWEYRVHPYMIHCCLAN